jgi:hypothetical protein
MVSISQQIYSYSANDSIRKIGLVLQHIGVHVSTLVTATN